MKIRIGVAIGIAVAIGLMALIPVMAHYQAKRSVANYRKQLQAQGEKLTIEELTPHIAAAKGGSPVSLESALPSPFYFLPTMRNVAPGRALVAWKETNSRTEDSTNTWFEASRQIHEYEPDLASLRAALKCPVASFDLDYSHGFPPVTHLIRTKQSAIWLSMASLLELHEDQPSNAWEDLKACVALTRLFEHEPLEISQLVRIAISQIALGTTWEALQYPGWQDD